MIAEMWKNIATGRDSSPDAALIDVQQFVADKLAGRSARVYEAGGGSFAIVPLPKLSNPTVVVVDIDETQLQNNKYANIKILGDIQVYDFPPDSFDLIVCNNVIEHLPAVDQAIMRFQNALAPNGLLLIGAPNPQSLFGMITKYSPHWFHVWFYRVILGRKNAGQPGQPPFRTIYHPIVSPMALLRFCDEMRLRPIYFNLYIGDNYTKVRNKRPVLGRLLTAAIGLMNLVTLKKLDLAYGDYHAVLQKPLDTI
jgi:SAM-dependent methyltransferase